MDIDQIATDFRAHSAEVKGILQAKDAKLAELDAALSQANSRLTEVEQKQSRRGGGPSPAQSAGWGAAVAESPEMAAFRADGYRGTKRIELKTLNPLTTGPTSGGSLIAPDRQAEITMLPQRALTIRALLRPGQTTSNLIHVMQQTTRTNNAAPTPETTQKPQSEIDFQAVDYPVRTVAHWIPVSRQVMDDAPQLQAVIDSELRYGLAQVEEDQLIAGDGTGENLLGLIPQASAFTAPFTVSNQTYIDEIRLGLLQARLAKYPSTGIVMNPTDWAKIELTKDAQGRYIVGRSSDGTPTLWNLPVVDSDAISAGHWLVGAFGLAAQIFDRMTAEVLISSEDRDNFIKNMLTCRGESRLALVVRRPAALVYGPFS